MEKEVLERYINEGLSIRQISHLVGLGFSTVKYYKDKFKIKNTIHQNFKDRNIGEKNIPDFKKCPKCNEIKSSDCFYFRRQKTELATYCKTCSNSKTLQRQIKFKIKCIEYKGGKCIICNYDKCIGALEFHHIDSSKKDFGIGDRKLSSFNEEIKNELDKCILLCSNCHREVHSGLIELPNIINVYV